MYEHIKLYHNKEMKALSITRHIYWSRNSTLLFCILKFSVYVSNTLFFRTKMKHVEQGTMASCKEFPAQMRKSY